MAATVKMALMQARAPIPLPHPNQAIACCIKCVMAAASFGFFAIK
jgi:hypothetical protein